MLCKGLVIFWLTCARGGHVSQVCVVCSTPSPSGKEREKEDEAQNQ